MSIPKELQEFLAVGDSLNEKYNTVKTPSGDHSLVHLFWSEAEVISSLKMREEWEVDLNLIPFWGNWHDLFCFAVDSSKVIEIDDHRNRVNEWGSISEFKAALCWIDEPPADLSKIVSAKLDF